MARPRQMCLICVDERRRSPHCFIPSIKTSCGSAGESRSSLKVESDFTNGQSPNAYGRLAIR